MSRNRSSNRYVAPQKWVTCSLFGLLDGVRGMPPDQQSRFEFGKNDEEERVKAPVYCAGDLSLLQRPCVAIVGTRKISENGVRRARRLSRELVENGVVVTSGLAMGVDTVALNTALEFGGSVVGVIGTPLDKVTPVSNAGMQETIAREHLLLSPFEHGQDVHRSNFPTRNKFMAALTDATVIVEASETSGTVHQAAECQRLGRWLFIMRSLIEEGNISWAVSFVENYEKAVVLDSTEQILGRLQDVQV